MHILHFEKYSQRERLAFFWEALWTSIALISLVAMFVLLYMRVR